MRRASYALDAFGTEYVQRHPSSLLLSAIINLREGKDRAAFDALLRYRRYDPANTTASRLLAISHLRQGNAKDAVRVLKPFMQSLAQDAQANAVIGRAKLLQKDLAQAQRYLKAATMLAPTDSD